MNAPSRHGGSAIQALHEKQPGRLYELGLEEVKKFLEACEGAAGEHQAAKMMTYLTAVLQGRFSAEKIGARSAHELKTLALAQDALGNGRLPQVADLLMQRFKGIELIIEDGTSSLANHVELAPSRAS
eukprot:4764885-Karenia_brevis.AAC.1